MELALKGTTVGELTAEETVYSSMDDNLHMLQVNVSQPDTQTDVVTSGIQPAVEVSETGIGRFYCHFWFHHVCIGYTTRLRSLRDIHDRVPQARGCVYRRDRNRVV